MATTLTTNKFFAKMDTGDEIGTWGTPVNANTGTIDASFGGVVSIGLTNSNVILSSAQFQNQFIVLTGALTASVSITFPAIGSFYTIINETTNSSNFFVTAKTTAVGSRQIGLPIGSMADLMTDGANVRFRGLPPVGTYWDYAGSSTPAWVSACTIPPYLYCNGTTFSSATYPALCNYFGGGVTLPDFRGRTAYQLNDGTSRMTAASAGLNGDVLFAAGGNQGLSVSHANLPNVGFTVTDPTHVHTITHNANGGTYSPESFSAVGQIGLNSAASITIDSNGVGGCGISVGSGGSGTPISLMKPTAITGIRMVRAG